MKAKNLKPAKDIPNALNTAVKKQQTEKEFYK